MTSIAAQAEVLPSTSERNEGIDMLRGLSIVLVVMHHVGLRIPLRKGVLGAFLPKWFLNALIYNGYEAVFVFFVISGFLIASNAMTRWGQLGDIDFRAFYTRRASRILPCLLILVGVLSALHLVGAQDYVISKAGQSLPRAIFSALGLHLNWFEGHFGYLPGNWDVLWSLSIEEVFYLAFPLVCFGLRKDRFLLPVLGVLALSLPWTRAVLAGNGIWQEKAYWPGMGGIAMGVAAALLAARTRRFSIGALRALGAVGIAGLIAVFCFEDRLWPWMGNGVMLVLTGATASLLLACDGLARLKATRPLPGTGWLRSFGLLSYEIYLTHMFIVWPIVRGFKTMNAGWWWGILWYPPALALSWGLGWLVARYISFPSERALRRFWAALPSEPEMCEEPS
jgi:peptidoglycan/LPS O-acetylase OafA/YrhL